MKVSKAIIKQWVENIVIVVCVLMIAVVIVIAIYKKQVSQSVLTGTTHFAKYEIQNKLLFEAIEQVGVCDPVAAATVWANGLKERNAATQYAVMNAKLKIVYAKNLEETAPEWVTGVSSPWISQHQILRTTQVNNEFCVIEVSFSTMTSSGKDQDYIAELTINREDYFWRISKIVMDRGLYPYTGFQIAD